MPLGGKVAYTYNEKVTALAVLAANGGNLSKTSRETGITRRTLKLWAASEIADCSEITTLKKDFQESHRSKIKAAREAALDQMIEILPDEKDVHKLVGAVKVLSEQIIVEEIARGFTNVNEID